MRIGEFVAAGHLVWDEEVMEWKLDLLLAQSKDSSMCATKLATDA